MRDHELLGLLQYTSPSTSARDAPIECWCTGTPGWGEEGAQDLCPVYEVGAPGGSVYKVSHSEGITNSSVPVLLGGNFPIAPSLADLPCIGRLMIAFNFQNLSHDRTADSSFYTSIVHRCRHFTSTPVKSGESH